MLKIWGRVNSINVQKALLCIEELGLPYERIDAGKPFAFNSTDEYLAMNPNGLVPTIRDGDLVLWESNVIVRYLCAKHASGRLWPETSVWPIMRPAFHGLVRTPGSFPPAEIEAMVASVEKMFDVLEHHFREHGCLAGDGFTMADCVIGPTVHRWHAMPVARAARPALEAWYAALMQRPAAQKVLILPLS